MCNDINLGKDNLDPSLIDNTKEAILRNYNSILLIDELYDEFVFNSFFQTKFLQSLSENKPNVRLISSPLLYTLI